MCTLLQKKSLPTAYELTGDPRWGKDGDLYALYNNLHLDADGPIKEKILGAVERLYVLFNDLEDIGIMDTIPDKSMLN